MRISDWSSDVCSSDLVVQVRPGGAAGGADVADDLALLHAGALGDALGDALHVGVRGLVGRAVAQAHVLPVAAVAAGVVDDAVAGGIDRRAAGGREVSALVLPRVAEERMLSHAEARGASGVDAWRSDVGQATGLTTGHKPTIQ